MSKDENPLKSALVIAVSRTLENMAFEQVELIEGDLKTHLARKKSEMDNILASLNESERDQMGDGAIENESEDQSDITGDYGKDEQADIESESVATDEAELWASIPLLRPLRGEMVIIFPSEYAAQLTEAIYGSLDSEGIKEITVNDAIAEIINIISGCFAQELLSSDTRFELGLPNTGWGETPSIENKAITLSFDLGGHILTAIVSGEDFCGFKNSQQLQEKVS